MLILISTLIYNIRPDAGRSFSLFGGTGFGKKVIIFRTDMSSSVHIDNKKKYIFILIKRPTDGLDDTMLTAEKDQFY